MSHRPLPFRQPGVWLASAVFCLALLASGLPTAPRPPEAAPPPPTPIAMVAPTSTEARSSNRELPGDTLALITPKAGTQYDRWPDYLDDSVRRCSERYVEAVTPFIWTVGVETSEGRVKGVDPSGLPQSDVESCVYTRLTWAVFDLEDGAHRRSNLYLGR